MMKNQYVSRTLLFFATMVMALWARAGNVVTIGSAEGVPGEEVTVSIGLEATDAVSSVQLQIPLSDNLQLVSGSAATTSRTANHSVTAGVKDGVLNVMVYSLSMKTIASGNGAIATFRLKLGNVPGVVALNAANVIMTDASGNTLSATSSNGQVNVVCAKAEYSQFTLDYGRIPIRSQYSQPVTVSNTGTAPLVITGLQFSNGKFSCAQTLPVTIAVGGNKQFDIDYAPTERGAVDETVKFISNSIYKVNTVHLKATPYAVNELHISDASGLVDSTVTVSLSVNNMDAITGFQFDFDLPEGLQYVDGSFALSNRKADQHLTVSTTGQLRAIAYSLTDTPFTGNDGVIATFNVRLCGRYSTTLSVTKAVLTANVNGTLMDVLSDKYSARIEIKSPKMQVAESLDFGETSILSPVTKTFVVYNNGSAPLYISRVVTELKNLKVENALPIKVEAYGRTSVKVVYDGTEEGEFSSLLQLYTNDPDCKMKNIKVSGKRFSPNFLSFTAADTIPSGVLKLKVDMNNNDVIDGFQFDVRSNETYFSALDDYILAARATGYSITRRHISTGVDRYFCYSLGGNHIEKGEGEVFTLMYSVDMDSPYGSYSFSIENVSLATGQLTDKYSGKNMQVAVNIVKPKYDITLNSGGHGSIVGAGRYELGSTITVSAVADEGYHFVSWSDDSTENPRTLTVNSDMELTATFAPNSYTVLYLDGDTQVAAYDVLFGENIPQPDDAPLHEGYTFVCWGDVPATMPVHDLTFIARYSVNSYVLTYIVDGEVYKSYTLDYGTSITPEPAPEKEGYSFSGWDDVPTTMPAHDVTVMGIFTICSYEVKLTTDGHGSVSGAGAYEYGSTVTVSAVADEGYHFVNWSDGSTENPRTLTVNSDMELMATFAPNSYKVLYLDGDTQVAAYDVLFGESIPQPDEAPLHEGYSFVGWGDVPATMPAHDLTFIARYSVNSYVLTYIVDGEVYKSYTLDYGTSITPEPAPEKEGYSFSGWDDVPTTMPAHDVTVTGTFIIYTGVTNILSEGSTNDVYTLSGHLVKRNATAEYIRRKIPEGVYIIGGKTVVVKKRN